MTAKDALLQLTDTSNWPEMESSEHAGYDAAMSVLHETIMEFWPELAAKVLPEKSEGIRLPYKDWNPAFASETE